MIYKMVGGYMGEAGAHGTVNITTYYLWQG